MEAISHIHSLIISLLFNLTITLLIEADKIYQNPLPRLPRQKLQRSKTPRQTSLLLNHSCSHRPHNNQPRPHHQTRYLIRRSPLHTLILRRPRHSRWRFRKCPFHTNRTHRSHQSFLHFTKESRWQTEISVKCLYGITVSGCGGCLGRIKCYYAFRLL